jgi:HD-GYP domain-containing protein (c-di-GMP phosphodiesterase class II)
VGRYGGDEFVSILKNAGRGAAEDYREKVTTAIRNATVFGSTSGDRVPIQASLGIAVFPDEAPSIEDVLALSDEAMYAVKRQRPLGRTTDPEKYMLNVGRLTGILGAFGPLLSESDTIQSKMEVLAQRLLTGSGSDAIVFTLWERPEAAPVVRSALAPTNQSLLAAVNSYFETLSYADHEIWQELFRSPGPLVVRDLEEDERISDSTRALATAAGIRSALIVPLIGPDTVIGALYVCSRQKDNFGPADSEFFCTVGEHLAAIANTSFLLARIKEGAARLAEEREATVMRLAAAAEAHDPAVGPHHSRVRGLSELIALELGYEQDAAREVGLAAALHDVGRLYISESLLASTGVLTAAERLELQSHTVHGARFLDGPGMELGVLVARYHHERWDGAGYPEGLQGEAIPEAAAITAVADSLDAMTHDRSYQRHRSLSEAIEEVSGQTGKQFSPKVVNALLSLYRQGSLGDVLSVESNQIDKAA